VEFAATDSPAVHAFDFTPSMSIFVECDNEAELDRVFAALSDGGKTLMPLNNYGFSKKFGWCNDRFGVSWQINLS
jgi:predicted 3-demethylubiquinone-9 3-methyltransferase (glyoxalase superfamily)